MTATLSVGDVLRAHGPAFLRERGASLPKPQRFTIDRLAACRTPALGGHVYRCDQCAYEQIGYNSCRDRHCPGCLAYRSAKWLRDRVDELLPVPYFHVVFTVPETVAALALGNRKVVYAILFQAAAGALIDVAKNPKRLGADIGLLAVLHTWSQTLTHHPHVHCVVPGGGLSADRTAWVASKPNFFLPVRVLSKVFRGKFIEALRRAKVTDKLKFGGSTSHLASEKGFERWIKDLRKNDWVVYSKKPFGSPEQVLKYLAAYTHRVAISNRRLVSMDSANVTFRHRDRASPDRSRTMTLKATEFIRRFMLHVLPKRFTRIRYFGFLANRVRANSLARCRELLGEVEVSDQAIDGIATTAPDTEPDHSPDDEPLDGKIPEHRRCPSCERGLLVKGREIPPAIATLPPFERAPNNTS